MTTTFQKGDKVSVLDDAFEGVVLKVENGVVTIETTDGFQMTYFVNELIKVNDSNNLRSQIGSFNSQKIKSEKDAPKKRYDVADKKIKGEIPPPEFDLHIEKLVKNFRHMSNFDILNIQMETAKRHLDFAVKNRIPKIVFIHGVGEGILKSELDFLLGRYDGIDFRDANFQKYGQGATEVYFKQNY
ncbi:Smr/MutS family protein [Flavobacterium sp. MAH-1]|uniref:Smr/MutS family protein n=1 Tax=Flavobacterium agri TaxID=2743471 RepID=A0A7Y8XZ21_9FLAO|nr:Smr/MutS family protein [Flavobacterium agri]NUY79390.1 Smr/MutS family protein [Flavobacterium agri]NYA69415.1 Smr/MutS family protein [Flavobacterium agri]